MCRFQLTTVNSHGQIQNNHFSTPVSNFKYVVRVIFHIYIGILQTLNILNVYTNKIQILHRMFLMEVKNM